MSEAPAGAERARTILEDLIRQRKGLRAAGVEEELLEANRLGIVYWQLQLAHAFADARETTEAA